MQQQFSNVKVLEPGISIKGWQRLDLDLISALLPPNSNHIKTLSSPVDAKWGLVAGLPGFGLHNIVTSQYFFTDFSSNPDDPMHKYAIPSDRIFDVSLPAQRANTVLRPSPRRVPLPNNFKQIVEPHFDAAPAEEVQPPVTMSFSYAQKVILVSILAMLTLGVIYVIKDYMKFNISQFLINILQKIA